MKGIITCKVLNRWLFNRALSIFFLLLKNLFNFWSLAFILNCTFCIKSKSYFYDGNFSKAFFVKILPWFLPCPTREKFSMVLQLIEVIHHNKEQALSRSKHSSKMPNF